MASVAVDITKELDKLMVVCFYITRFKRKENAPSGYGVDGAGGGRFLFRLGSDGRMNMYVPNVSQVVNDAFDVTAPQPAAK